MELGVRKELYWGSGGHRSKGREDMILWCLYTIAL